MKFKKALIFVMCIVMCLPLVACDLGIQAPGSDPNNPPVGNGKPCYVTFVVGDEAKAAGVKVMPMSQEVLSGGTLSQMPVVSGTYPGYTLTGWYDSNGKQYTTATKITSDVKLTAKWESAAEINERAKAYESKISSWAKSGHLYIHYKRGAHLSSEEVIPPTSGTGSDAPLYNKASTSTVYKDWALWCWPKNGEGRTYNAAWVDESGAVYDVDLTREYNDGGWDSDAGKILNSKIEYKDEVGTQLFMVSSRAEDGYWKNDGGNKYITVSKIKRDGGDAHWFVSEGRVGKGSKTYAAEEVPDPYANVAPGTATTKTAGVGFINSNNANPSAFPQWSARVTDFDSSTGYQIFIASFKDSDGDGLGDIQGIIDELPYLASLNVDVLWLTPFQTSTNYHGYDIDDYFSVDPRWGSAEDYRTLVTEAHKKGMKIVMDFVLNHTSEANEWFVKSKNLTVEKAADVGFELSNKSMTEVDYRQFYSWINGDGYNALHDCTPASKKADGHKCEKDQWFGDEHGYYFYSSFSSTQPELNFDYQPVRDAILDVCYKWMDPEKGYALDGFRLDAVKHIYMKNEVEAKGGTCQTGDPLGNGGVVTDGLYSHDQIRNFNFYREFNYRLKSKYPNAFVVGENLDGYNLRTKNYLRGLDSQFEFNAYYASRGFASIRGINKINKQGNVVNDGDSPNENWMSGVLDMYVRGYNAFKQVNPNFISGQFTSNHDLPRARNRMALSGTDGGETDRYATISGNLINDSYYALFLYYGMQFTLPGVTWLYYGDEIGMEGIMDYTISTGSTDSLTSQPHEDRVYRQPMKWTATTDTSFGIGFNSLNCELTGLNATSNVQSVAEQQTDPNSLLNWVKTLTAIRKQYKLGTATLDVQSAKGSGNRMEYVVNCANNKKIKVVITAGSSAGTGSIASKTVTIGGKTCGVAISEA